VALNKANARDIAKARSILGTQDGERMYAATLAGIHRSSSRLQQVEVEHAICDDGMCHLFYRHPVNGCMLAAPSKVAA
jgi:hypothetical protein